jgi:hypothetical protein
MMALESSEQNASSILWNGNEEAKRDQCEQLKTKFGFSVTFVDNNSVHVRDALGKEVAFAFPMADVSLAEYDNFIHQMQNDNRPLPSVGAVKLSVGKALADASLVAAVDRLNSGTHPRTWEKHAANHRIGVDEMKAMYFFAREELYARFKSRLRSTKS